MGVRDWLPAAARSAAIEYTLKAGEPLFRLGDKTVGLWEVTTGRVRLARVDHSGHEIVLHVAGPGETLALRPLCFLPNIIVTRSPVPMRLCAYIPSAKCWPPLTRAPRLELATHSDRVESAADGSLTILSDGKPIGWIRATGVPVTMTPVSFGPGKSRLGIIRINVKAGNQPGPAEITGALNGGTEYKINIVVDVPKSAAHSD